MSQPTIRVVVKTDTGTVADAVVSANGRSVQTGRDGVAVVPSSLGAVKVNVAKEGYFPAHTTITVEASQQAQLEVELQPEKAEEEEITVYATRTNARLQDSPLHVEVVGTDEINEELAMRPGDISMLLNEMGSIRVQTTSPGLGASSVRVQGMRGRYTAFLSDGLPLFGQQGAGLGLLQIPPMDLGNSKLLRAPPPRSMAVPPWREW